MKHWPIFPALLLLLAMGVPHASSAQYGDFPDLFTFHVIEGDGQQYLNTEPDSMPGDPTLDARCTALWQAHEYLYCNYSIAYAKQPTLSALLPDTAAIRRELMHLLRIDTVFQQLYLRSVERQMVAPLPIDSALRIAAHFFYVHRYAGQPTMHFCVGINKVMGLSASASHPYHAAFCYMALQEMNDPLALYKQVREPFVNEVKAGPSDERLAEIEQAIYERIAALPDLRQALIASFRAHEAHLNFALAY